MMPQTRLGQAHYLVADTVKLRYLFRIFMREGLWPKRESASKKNFLPASRTIMMRAHDGRVPLPSPDLLKVHCAIADILHATGMAEKIDKILDDTEAALISQSCFQ